MGQSCLGTRGLLLNLTVENISVDFKLFVCCALLQSCSYWLLAIDVLKIISHNSDFFLFLNLKNILLIGVTGRYQSSFTVPKCCISVSRNLCALQFYEVQLICVFRRKNVDMFTGLICYGHVRYIFQGQCLLKTKKQAKPPANKGRNYLFMMLYGKNYFLL